MSGQPEHARLAGARSIGPGTTEPRFDLVDLGAQAALVPGGLTAVRGEVYALGPALLASIDVYKGHPVLHQRRPVRLDDGREGAAGSDRGITARTWRRPRRPRATAPGRAGRAGAEGGEGAGARRLASSRGRHELGHEPRPPVGLEDRTCRDPRAVCARLPRRTKWSEEAPRSQSPSGWSGPPAHGTSRRRCARERLVRRARSGRACCPRRRAHASTRARRSALRIGV